MRLCLVGKHKIGQTKLTRKMGFVNKKLKKAPFVEKSPTKLLFDLEGGNPWGIPLSMIRKKSPDT